MIFVGEPVETPVDGSPILRICPISGVSGFKVLDGRLDRHRPLRPTSSSFSLGSRADVWLRWDQSLPISPPIGRQTARPPFLLKRKTSC